jgi:hypothetical protein
LITIHMIAEFLAEVQSTGKSGSTVNTARSSLCGVYGVLLSRPLLAKHPLLSGVVRSAKLAVPLQPRYDDIWDAALIPQYWSRTPTPTIARKREKAISLSILALFARPSDLERISSMPAHFKFTQTGYEFRIRGAKEGKSPSKLTPVIPLPLWSEERIDNHLGLSCCPAAAWQTYLDAVEASSPNRLPPNAQRYPHGIFLALTPQPFTLDDGARLPGRYHTPLSAQRISKIMKDVMFAAGVDTSIFKGGSGRHAGSSAAFADGEEMERILARGRWSSFETFRRFYLRARITQAMRAGMA